MHAILSLAVAVSAATAPPAVEIREETHRISIDSQALGETREILVDLPAGYESSRLEYPVLFVLDAPFPFGDAAAIASFLAKKGAMPPAIVVGITNNNREQDMTPEDMRIPWVPNPRADSFARFLADEVLAEISERYRVSDLVVLAGHSHGGIFATWLASQNRAPFDILLAFDFPWHIDDRYLPRRLIEGLENRENPVRLIVGEATYFATDDDWNNITVAAPAGSILERFAVTDESHMWMYFKALYQGLSLAFRPYSDAMQSDNSTSLVISRYKAASNALGGRLVPHQAALITEIDLALTNANVDEAEELNAMLADLYGNSEITAAYASRINEDRKKAPLEVTLAELLATPKATAAEIEPYVGRWSGTMGFEGFKGNPVIFEIRIEGGVAAGQCLQPYPNGKVGEIELDYIRVEENTVKFGYMNQMNPRGLLLHTLERNGDELLGGMEMAGIRFEPPGGRQMPKSRTHLVKE